MDKTVVITGGAGGLGRAAARRFAAEGFSVFSCDSATPPTETGITDIPTDVTSAASLACAISLVGSSHQQIDVLLCTAGIYDMGSFVELSEERLKRILDINLLGVYRTVKAFLPLMREKGRIIILTSELAPQKPLPFNGVYSLSKAALDHYAASLRLELNLLGIKVIVFRPGAFGTGMIGASNRAMQRMCAETKLYTHNANVFQRVMASQSGTARPPELLAGLLYQAAVCRRPRLVYSPNAGLGLKLYSLLPYRVGLFAIRLLLSGAETPKRRQTFD